MKPLLLALVLTFVFSVGAFAQKPPVEPDVVKISTNLVQVDVTVTDSKGRAITDLKPNEIEILENGERQRITNFSFVSSGRVLDTDRRKVEISNSQTAVPDQTPVPKREEVRRTIALVVDDLSLSLESVYFTRRALKKFVDEQMEPNDLVAIIRTGSSIGALQQFTSDKRILYAAIERVKWNPSGNGGMTAFDPFEPKNGVNGAPMTVDESTDDTAEPNKKLRIDRFRDQVYTTSTLGALRYIVTGMGEMPGRKSVILFSDGFRLFQEDEDKLLKDHGTVLDYLRLVVDRANRSSVIFYTVDVRGLQTASFTAADSLSNIPNRSLGNFSQYRRRVLIETQEGLQYLSRETGGLSIQNSNDLSDGVKRILEDQSYYLVAYEPSWEKYENGQPQYNSLKINVLRKGAQVRYRSGFFGSNDGAQAATSGTAASPIQALESAVSSPFSTNAISIGLNALFGNDATRGSYVRSYVHVDAKDLTFKDEPDGSKKALFEILAVSFGDNGKVVDRLSTSYSFVVKPGMLDTVLKNGFVYNFVLPVKMHGAYQYRVALRDAASGKVGTAGQFIQVPNLKNDKLTTSSILIENVSPEAWKKLNDPSAPLPPTLPLTDVALRRVRSGSVLRYGFEVYNAKKTAGAKPNVSTRVRVFQDGKLIMDGAEKPIDVASATDSVHTVGAIAVGDEMPPGDYVLQIIVTDKGSSNDKNVVVQTAQFEVVR